MTTEIKESLSGLPVELGGVVSQYWQSWLEGAMEHCPALIPEITDTLPAVWSASDYVAKTCIRHPQWLAELMASGDLLNSIPADEWQGRLQCLLEPVCDMTSLQRVLRQFRNQSMLRIFWRDIAGWAELEETTRDLSLLAETCIDGALQRLYQWQCEESGIPFDANGKPMNLVIIGMGKLGACELNVSSDIDLIFAYPEDGEIQGAARPLTHAQFFTRLGQRLIQALDQTTADGFVFRVDMRLRPFGDSGPLAVSFEAMETYYQIHGREWERYAMIKARVVGGDREAGAQLMRMLHPFVYRRYLDYGAYESLRDMKAMIMREVRRKGLDNNVKLGAGGIREVEFIAQVFQLIRGGRDTALQTQQLLPVLSYLAKVGNLPDAVVTELKAAYVFLRATEHRLQEYRDQQTHVLPSEALAQLRLAVSMGYADWAGFSRDLQSHRTRVQAHFERVFEAPQTSGEGNTVQKDLESLWQETLEASQVPVLLSESGYKDVEEVARRLHMLRHSHVYRALSSTGRKRLDQLMPLLLGAAGGVEAPDLALVRVLDLLERIARRSVYLALLVENPLALSQLVRLCGASPWIARYLAQHPLLLDDLLDPRALYAPPDKPTLKEDLQHRLAAAGRDDLEQAMDGMRHFKHSNVLRVAAADVAGALPLMKVSDQLSWLAEVILDEALELAWSHVVERHGAPPRDESATGGRKGFAIIAYGKLGGLELGYGSDLDLVFLHGVEDSNLMTDGDSPLAVPVFFARLGQRLIHLLTAQTSAGVLYEVDMRLRPDGASGLLVSSLKAYGAYQRDKAWVWEHQALVRARAVAGDHAIAEGFTKIRREILCREKDRGQLRQEIRDMRRRMRTELVKGEADAFDLKQGEGGIVDIEFMVQYAVLGWAHQYPELTDYTDNIRILARMAETGLMTAEEVEALSDAYRGYRSRLHRMALQEQSGLVSDREFSAERRTVSRIWRQWMED